MRLREVVGLSRNHISLLNFEPLENLDSFLIRGKSSEFATQRVRESFPSYSYAFIFRELTSSSLPSPSLKLQKISEKQNLTARSSSCFPAQPRFRIVALSPIFYSLC